MKKETDKPKAAPAATLAECAEVLTRFVHFTSKPVNSNAATVGIRLAPSDRLALPAIAARTLLPVPLDYAGLENGRPATVAKQMKAAEAAEAPTDEQVELLRIVEEVEQTRLEIGTERISPRLRQILIERNDDTLALVPLASPGLCELVAKRAETFKPRPRRAFLPIGGKNLQNVSSRSALCRPLVYDAPQEQPDLRRAFAIHYACIAPTLPAADMNRYSEHHARSARKTWTLAAKTEERALLTALLAPTLRQAERARALLTAHRETLGTLLDPTVDAVTQGLIDPERRGKHWRQRFSIRIARRIADAVKCDGTETLRIAATIEGLLQ